MQKVYAVFSKGYTYEKYSVSEKIDKSFRSREILFSEEIEKLLRGTKQDKICGDPKYAIAKDGIRTRINLAAVKLG